MPNEGNEPGAVARFGYVSAYDPKRHMARVRFPDKGDVVSDWLPVTVPNTKRNKDERPLDVDEHVFCVMMGNGLEAGAILGAVYDDTNKPPIGNQDIRATTFEDGTSLSYDRKEHRLVIDVCEGGSVEITAHGQTFTMSSEGNMTIIGPKVITLDAQGRLALRSQHIHTDKNSESEGSYS